MWHFQINVIQNGVKFKTASIFNHVLATPEKMFSHKNIISYNNINANTFIRKKHFVLLVSSILPVVFHVCRCPTFVVLITYIYPRNIRQIESSHVCYKQNLNRIIK